MPIEVGIWRFYEQLTRMEFRKLEPKATPASNDFLAVTVSQLLTG